ncbi:unnamed protein product [Ectocarpus sp. 12 AP-2014]
MAARRIASHAVGGGLRGGTLGSHHGGADGRPQEWHGSPPGRGPGHTTRSKTCEIEEGAAAKGTGHAKEPATEPACNQKRDSTT